MFSINCISFVFVPKPALAFEELKKNLTYATEWAQMCAYGFRAIFRATVTKNNQGKGGISPHPSRVLQDWSMEGSILSIRIDGSARVVKSQP